MNAIEKLLIKYGASSAGTLPFTSCDIINEKLVRKIGFSPKSVCIATLPYYTPACDNYRIISSYSLSYDYHNLIQRIGNEVVREAKLMFPTQNFVCFGDHSPINEKTAAAKAGLGIIGAHSLLITPMHSSYVFLFEIFTNLDLEYVNYEIQHCEMCGKCKQICPSKLSNNGKCVSEITQKKGSLTTEEEILIYAVNSAWGCDMCQMVCPHTIKAIENKTIYTSMDWFYNNIIPVPSIESINDTDDFVKRAYSWRGKPTILRNIDILNKKDVSE